MIRTRRLTNWDKLSDQHSTCKLYKILIKLILKIKDELSFNQRIYRFQYVYKKLLFIICKQEN